MSGVIGGGVTLRGVNRADEAVTFNLAAAVTADAVDKPMAIDTSANATLKLAADGDVVYAPLATFEDREVEGIKTGAALPQGFFSFPYSGTAPTIGSSIVADGNGGVKTAGTANNSKVMEVDAPSGYVTVRIVN